MLYYVARFILISYTVSTTFTRPVQDASCSPVGHDYGILSRRWSATSPVAPRPSGVCRAATFGVLTFARQDKAKKSGDCHLEHKNTIAFRCPQTATNLATNMLRLKQRLPHQPFLQVFATQNVRGLSWFITDLSFFTRYIGIWILWVYKNIATSWQHEDRRVSWPALAAYSEGLSWGLLFFCRCISGWKIPGELAGEKGYDCGRSQSFCSSFSNSFFWFQFFKTTCVAWSFEKETPCQVTLALEHLHSRGIVFRDLKSPGSPWSKSHGDIFVAII